jgi:hypothetical protein
MRAFLSGLLDPVLAFLLFLVLFFGGCHIAVRLHIVSSSTRLMPY